MAWRKDGQGIDVPLRVIGKPDPQMHVRPVDLRRPTGADRADGVPLLHVGAAGYVECPEVNERHGVAGARLDGESPAVRADAARERHGTACGRKHPCLGRPGDVDATMLSSGVRIVADGERPGHIARDWPGPGLRDTRKHEGARCSQHQHASHHDPPVVDIANVPNSVAGASAVVKNADRAQSEPR
jgi:hypothetical protein